MTRTPPPLWMLPDPVPYQGAQRCSACGGAKITTGRFMMELRGGTLAGAKPAKLLMVAAWCPVCGGCGRGEHAGCSATDHAADHDDHAADVPDGEKAPRCAFCGGRQWWAAKAWSADSAGVVGGNGVTLVLRMPCSCAEALLVPVPA